MTHTSQCAVKGYCPAEAMADAAQLEMAITRPSKLKTGRDLAALVPVAFNFDGVAVSCAKYAARAYLRAIPALRRD